MPTSVEGAKNSTPPSEPAPKALSSNELREFITNSLDDVKAVDVITIDLAKKSSIGDFMLVASGTSTRHVGAIADRVTRDLRLAGHGRPRVEGLPNCDWVLIDTGDVIVHVFRPEVREFYNIEKMWSAARPESSQDLE